MTPETCVESGSYNSICDDATEDAGALIHHPPKGNAASVLAASMLLGAVKPTEVVFAANVTADNRAEKLDKKLPLPPNNFLHPEYKDKPFRIYTVVFRADISRMKLIETPDGVRHGTVEFVAVVYDQSGETVNSLLSTASVNQSVPLSSVFYQDKHHGLCEVAGLGFSRLQSLKYWNREPQ